MESAEAKKGSRIKQILTNKYLLTILIFIAYMLFFDANSFIDRATNKGKIRQLRNEISYYEELVTKNKAQMNELQSSDENIEKFAREQFLMKKENEDIFIINK